jgi:hypothetical protein
MVKKLSEELADLSAHAKRAEDSLAAAQKEERDKIAARKAQAHAATTAALAKVDQEVRSFDGSVSQNWDAAKAKVAADMAALKARVATARHDRDVKQARQHADALEQDACYAIDYAIAMVEQANLAVLDAVEARVQADAAARP